MSQLTIKLIAILAVAGGLFASGWIAHGWKYDAELSKQMQAAKIKEIEQYENTYQVAVAYTDMLSTLDKRLRHKQSLPRPPVSPEGVDDPTGEYGITCTRAFYEAGLRDAVKIQGFHDWVIKHKIPVK